jgi:hypothetical protein
MMILNVWNSSLNNTLIFTKYVKDRVYVPPLPTNFDDLKHRITTAINSVDRDMLIRAWEEFSYRIDVARAAGGGHIEDL